MTEASVIGLLEATVSFGALLYLAALGEMITEKAGILNLGVEGMMAMGAVTGFVVALHTGNPWVALAGAVAAGAAGAAPVRTAGSSPSASRASRCSTASARPATSPPPVTRTRAPLSSSR